MLAQESKLGTIGGEYLLVQPSRIFFCFFFDGISLDITYWVAAWRMIWSDVRWVRSRSRKAATSSGLLRLHWIFRTVSLIALPEPPAWSELWFLPIWDVKSLIVDSQRRRTLRISRRCRSPSGMASFAWFSASSRLSSSCNTSLKLARAPKKTRSALDTV